VSVPGSFGGLTGTQFKAIELAVQVRNRQLLTDLSYELSNVNALIQRLQGTMRGGIVSSDDIKLMEELVTKQRELQAQMKGAEAAIKGGGAVTMEAIKQNQAWARAILEVSRGLEDFTTGGWRGALNNIPMIMMNGAQAFGLSAEKVAQWTARISFAATLGTLFYENWRTVVQDGIPKLFGGMLSDAETFQKKYQLSWAEWSGNWTQATMPIMHNAAKRLQIDFDVTTKAVEDFEKKGRLTDLEFGKYREAKGHLRDIELAAERAAEADKKLKRQLSGLSEEETERIGTVDKTAKKVGGPQFREALEQLIRQNFESSTTRPGMLVSPLGGKDAVGTARQLAESMLRKINAGDEAEYALLTQLFQRGDDAGADPVTRKAAREFRASDKARQKQFDARGEQAEAIERRAEEEAGRRMGSVGKEFAGDYFEGVRSREDKEHLKDRMTVAIADRLRAEGVDPEIIGSVLQKLVEKTFQSWENKIREAEGGTEEEKAANALADMAGGQLSKAFEEIRNVAREKFAASMTGPGMEAQARAGTSDEAFARLKASGVPESQARTKAEALARQVEEEFRGAAGGQDADSLNVGREMLTDAAQASRVDMRKREQEAMKKIVEGTPEEQKARKLAAAKAKKDAKDAAKAIDKTAAGLMGGIGKQAGDFILEQRLRMQMIRGMQPQERKTFLAQEGRAAKFQAQREERAIRQQYARRPAAERDLALARARLFRGLTGTGTDAEINQEVQGRLKGFMGQVGATDIKGKALDDKQRESVATELVAKETVQLGQRQMALQVRYGNQIAALAGQMAELREQINRQNMTADEVDNQIAGVNRQRPFLNRAKR
jgi:hypothetical protein